VGDELLPNTAFASGPITVVNRPTVSWIVPETSECTARRTSLVVLADSNLAVRSVQFFQGKKRIAIVRRGGEGLYGATWNRGGRAKGRYTLRAVVTDSKGRKAQAQRVVRVCQ
jgi:hypothetical protein